MIFGFLAILCWLLLICTILALPIVAFRKNHRGVAALSAFLLGGLMAAALIWQATRPEGLSFRESLRAGLTDDGLLEYGHPIEHWAENAICLSSYAWVLGGALFAGVTVVGMRAMTRRKST